VLLLLRPTLLLPTLLVLLLLLLLPPSAAEILEGVLPSSFHSRLAYLSGPSFAAEVAKELPTVVTIAAKVGKKLQQP
jgi:hypothetical protein